MCNLYLNFMVSPPPFFPQTVFLPKKHFQKKEGCVIFKSSIHPQQTEGDVGVVEITGEYKESEESMKNGDRKKPISCMKSDLCQWMTFISVFCLPLLPTVHQSLYFSSLLPVCLLLVYQEFIFRYAGCVSLVVVGSDG